MMWLTGGALVICLVMIAGLLGLIFAQGIGTFWPREIVRVATLDGDVYMGEVTRSEEFRVTEELIGTFTDDKAERARKLMEQGKDEASRRLVRTGNFDITNTHFHWVGDFEIVNEALPDWAVVVERRAWGRFYGIPTHFEIDGDVVATRPEEVWVQFNQYHDDVSDRFRKRFKLQRYDLGHIHARQEKARLDLKTVEMREGTDSEAYRQAKQKHDDEIAAMEGEKQRIDGEIAALQEENDRYAVLFTTAQGQDVRIPLDNIVRAYPANRVGLGDKIAIYASRWREFLLDEPREANSEGGVWPAIVGTVVMTLLMSLVVVPFGVLAALYLREYARSGPLVSSVRIAVNNLAGVPSIVFGVFGLGFFCYIVGASLDELMFAAKLPNPTFGKGGVLWAALTLALLTLPVVIVATEESLAAVPSSMRHGSYACGASKWQTIRRIVLPRAMPGIMTGLILAMARGAGEVAPLMLVGAVKLAPDLPIDAVAPFLHPDRSFMHLGFHIYDVGFQSQNSEAAKPMVFTTTLLLITIIAALNIAAVMIRSRLRRKFVTTQF
jgi:phosphate transport system permease protein